MASRRKPIYSIHEEDPELQEPINDFVLSLAERIDGDWEEYDQAMVKQDAVVVLVRPERVYGRIR